MNVRILTVLSVAVCLATLTPVWAQFGASALSPEGVITAAERSQEIAAKMDRLVGWMSDEGYDGVLINQYRNFQWITAGADMQVVTASERGPVTLAIRADGRRFYLCNNSEGARMRNEELGELGYRGLVWEWHEGMGEGDAFERAVTRFARGGKLASDFDCEWADNRAGDIAKLRHSLTEPEIKKLRWLCQQSADACEVVCRTMERGITEKQVQAMISDELMRREIQPTVLLIASDERLFRYRHPIATDETVDEYCQVNICAKKWGLVVAVTRYVHFGDLSDELATKLQGCARVCGAYLEATVPGATAGDILAAGQRAYAEVGFPEEWRLHHQGGAIGYEEREWVAYPGAPMVVQPNQAFAWNPTITGAKVEDTVLVREDGTIENLTETGNWPTIPVRVRGQLYNAPAILIR